MVGEIRRTVVLARPPEEVWKALTDADQISAWFGAEVELDPHARGRASFRWPDGRARDAVVEVADPPRELALRWLPFERDAQGRAYQRPAGRVTFLIDRAESGSLLTVTESRAGAQYVSQLQPELTLSR